MPNTLKIKRGTAATIPQGQLAEPLFTTDTYDLYIGKGSGGNQRIQNYIASGTSSQFLKGDGSLDSTTYQTALTFSSPLVNTSGTVTINQSSGSANGYLSSTDWTTFNSKEPAITAGTTSQYYRGDKTFQTLDTAAVPENGSIYFTEPRVRATVLTGLNLSGGGTIAATDSILTAFGKVQNQISALVGGATYQGTWNASTNTPTLASGTGTKGYYYVVSVAGSTNLDGITDWKIGDWAIFNGTTWDKVDNTDAVSSVNGFTGAVNLALDNISDVSAASPTNAQLLRFNGTSSLWENWTPNYITGNQTITLSGDVSGSGTTTIATTIGALKVTNAMLAGSIDYAKMDGTTVPTWNQDTTGNAATADKWKTARTLTIGATGKSVDGSANVTWSASDIGLTNYLPLSGGTLTGALAGTTFDFNVGDRTFKSYGYGTDLVTSATGGWAQAHRIYNTNDTANTWFIGVFSGTFYIKCGDPAVIDQTGYNATGLTISTAGAATFASSVTATSIIKSGGTSSQFLKADGTIDSNTYLTGNQTITLSGDVTGSGATSIATTIANNAVTTSKINNAAVTAAKLATFGHNDAINWSANTDDAFIKFVSTGDGTGESALEIGTGDNGNERIRFTQRDGAVTYTRVYIDTDGELYKGGGTKYIYNTGTWDINTTGSAATLTTARNFTINGTAKSFNGSANVSWTAAEIGLTSYLPLTGGTLTGTLSGTSATFSSTITGSRNDAGNISMTLANAYINQGNLINFQHNTAGTTTQGYIGHGGDNTGNFVILNNGITAVSFARATGAATFSSSVTATGGLISNGGSIGYGGGELGFNVTTSGATSGIYTTATGSPILYFDHRATGNTGFWVWRSGTGGGTTALTLSNTGAATFSSSVGTTALNMNNMASLGSIGGGSIYLPYTAVLMFRSTDGATAKGKITSDNSSNLLLNDGGGNVGIGTTSPDVTGFGYTTLTIKGGTTAGYAGVLELQTTQTTTNGQNVGIIAFLDGASRNAQIGVQRDTSTSTSNMMFYTNAGSGIVERMRITSGGNVLIGTTTDNGYKLNVNGSFNFNVGSRTFISYEYGTDLITSATGGWAQSHRIYNTNDTANTWFIGVLSGSTFYIKCGNPATTDATGYNATGFTISSAGAGTFASSVTATSFFESSDIRLKSNIQDYKSNDILNISAKIYEKDGKIEVGYLAQDLKSVLKSAVSIRENGYLDLSYRQVHTAKIAALEAKIKELEAKLK